MAQPVRLDTPSIHVLREDPSYFESIDSACDAIRNANRGESPFVPLPAAARLPKDGSMFVEEFNRRFRTWERLDRKIYAQSEPYFYAFNHTTPPYSRVNDAILDVINRKRSSIQTEQDLKEYEDYLLQAIGDPQRNQKRLHAIWICQEAADRIIECYENGSLQLDLSGLKLSELPQGVFDQIPQIQELNLSDNRLDSLPPEIAQLKNLRQIDIRGNPFKEIPQVLKSLQGLKIICVAPCNSPPDVRDFVENLV